VHSFRPSCVRCGVQWYSGLFSMSGVWSFFFFQAEDGIRDRNVTGVQTCALPISAVDGRVMFVLPWEDLSYIGTTDTDEDVSPDDVYATAADVTYLLRSANALFPQARLAPQDVVATWAGLRPLLAPARNVSASDASREHRVIESPSGLITIAGGKLTTYRVMGRDVANRVAARLSQL